jgi:hypothetical protein
MNREDFPEFTHLDAHAVNHAMIWAQDEAKEREERMPTSAEAIRKHAAELKVVRDKILSVLPESVRRNYPSRTADGD